MRIAICDDNQLEVDLFKERVSDSYGAKEIIAMKSVSIRQVIRLLKM